jgi:hypothetical protein
VLGIAIVPASVSAAVIPVKHKEGTSHGFIVLRSQDGQQLATGEMVQTVEAERVTTELVLHFNDGSIFDEVTVFSDKSNFRLLTDHLRQQGPTFPDQVDSYIDAVSGNVKISLEKKGKDKDEQQHVDIPEDAANGLILTLLKNLSPSVPESTVSFVTTSSKPKVVKLKIHSEGEQRFSASGHHLNATHYVVHTEIGGVKGALANVAGKQPADIHCWILGGKAPAFLKFTGQLYEGGPVWNIELASVRWDGAGSAEKEH